MLNYVNMADVLSHDSHLSQRSKAFKALRCGSSRIQWIEWIDLTCIEWTTGSPSLEYRLPDLIPPNLALGWNGWALGTWVWPLAWHIPRRCSMKATNTSWPQNHWHDMVCFIWWYVMYDETPSNIPMRSLGPKENWIEKKTFNYI